MDEPADYRYVLANERTFLAYARTALALQITGLGVLQFLTRGQSEIRYTFGMVLVVVGSVLAVTGYRRYRSNDRAIRAGAEIGRSGSATLAAVAVIIVPLLAAGVLVLFGAV